MDTQQEGCHDVCVTKTEMVYPRPHQNPETHQSCLLKLSNLDRQCPVLLYLVFFYRSPPPPPHKQHPSQESLFSSLKMGLQDTLAAWYPAAGRLFLSPDTRILDLMCNSAGAIMLEADTAVELSQLGDLSQYKSFYEHLVFRPPFFGDVSEVPLLVAQVTKFGCGGYAVGVGISHSLFDGWANFNFLNAWASKVRAGATEDRLELVRPVHERDGLLLEQDKSQHQFTGVPREHKAVRVLAFDHIHQLIGQAASNLGIAGENLGGCKYAEMTFAGEQQHVLLTYRVTHGMIEKLKREATSGKSGISCSSFEVVAAHLWQVKP